MFELIAKIIDGLLWLIEATVWWIGRLVSLVRGPKRPQGDSDATAT